MNKEKPLTLEQRKTRLTSLIEDCINLGANKLLIKNYKKQLKEVEKEIKEQKKGSKSRIPNNLTEFNNPPNQICCVDLYESPVIKDIEREDKELYQNSF